MESIILVGEYRPERDTDDSDAVGRLLHATLHPDCRSECVSFAYLQDGAGNIRERIDESVQGGASKVILHPFSLYESSSLSGFIDSAVKEAEVTHPDVEFISTEPLGVHEKVVQVVAERIAETKRQDPLDIEKRSFEIIAEDTDLSDFAEEELPVIKRVIHATGDYEFKRTLIFHPDAITTGIKAIKSGMDILTDVEMVKAGINKKLLGRWGGRVICLIQDPRCLKEDRKNLTRSEKAIELALKENNNIGIIATGNAPTALLKTIEIFNNSSNGASHSSLVVGVPVGFVKALESKVMLSKQNFPFITNLSRKGGTPVAVAIVNALLKMADEG